MRIKNAVLLLSVVVSCLCRPTGAAAPKPNILWLIAEDFGQGE